jgi:hypothetical protein
MECVFDQGEVGAFEDTKVNECRHDEDRTEETTDCYEDNGDSLLHARLLRRSSDDSRIPDEERMRVKGKNMRAAEYR